MELTTIWTPFCCLASKLQERSENLPVPSMIWLLCFSLLFLFAFLFDFHLGTVVYMKWRLTNALYVCMYVCMYVCTCMYVCMYEIEAKIFKRRPIRVGRHLFSSAFIHSWILWKDHILYWNLHYTVISNWYRVWIWDVHKISDTDF